MMTMPTWTRRDDRTPLMSLLALLLLPGLVFVGCSGGDEEETAATTSSADKLAEAKADAEKNMAKAEEAEAATYAKKKFEQGVRYLEEAKELDENGSAGAASKYRRAMAKFRDAVKDVAKNKEKFEVVKQGIAEYEKLREDAKKAGVAELDPEGWEAAAATFKQGQDHLEDGNPTKARSRIALAVNDLKMSMEQAKEKLVKKGEAEELRVAVAEMRQKAVDAKADALAATDMAFADTEEKEAEKAFAAADFNQAIYKFNSAKNTYAFALKTASTLTLAGNGASQQVGLDAKDASSAAPKVEEIPIPDSTGDIDIATSLVRLFRVSPEYERGILSLNYTVGTDFQKDIDVRAGGEYMHFEGSDFVGFGIEEYVLAGNTRGYVLLNAGFEDGCQIEFDFQAQLVLPDNPFFMLIAMSNGRRDFYASNFGTDIRVYEDKRTTKRIKSAVAKYNQHPNKWIQKRDPIHMKMKYRKPSEDEEGLLQVWYDGEECCSTKIDKYRKGRIGFFWHNVKFYIRDLQVKGFLDEEWAKDAIASGGAKTEAPETDDFDF